MNRSPTRSFATLMFRRHSIALCAILLAYLAPAGSSAAPATTSPALEGIPRSDGNSQIAHEQLLQKARTGRIDVYFEGDSITRRWGTNDPQYKDFLANWKENFYGWNAANFGWGGDTAQNILWRLQNGELDGVNPKAIVLMAGTNNVGNRPGGDEAKVEEATAAIGAILEVMRSKAPQATIILMGITPRNDGPGGTATVAIIDKINTRISKLADGRKIRYLNINDKRARDDGTLLEGMTIDGLHLSVRGYQVWADALKPLLSEILGPPAKIDLAPPPSGNPSAQRRQ